MQNEELGMRNEVLVPPGWVMRRLGDLCSITTGFRDVNEGRPDGQYPFYSCSRNVLRSDTYSFNGEALLIAGNGDVGNLHYYNGKFEAYQRTYVLMDFKVDIRYIAKYLERYLIVQLNEGKVGSSIPYIVMGQLTNLLIPVPPLEEQKRIAEVLADADALIANTEKRIAKRKLIKQGMMQKLLTGAVRLPGFVGEWEEKSLAKIGRTYGGISGKRAGDFGHGNGRYVTFLNVLNNTVIDPSFFENVDIEPNEKQHRVLKGDLLFNTSSETPEEVGFCSLVNGDYKDLYLNSFCFGYRLNDQSLDGHFLAYWFRGKEGRAVMTLMAQGCTRYNLSKERFNAISIKVPPTLAEQQAIAAVLTDMDSEIAGLEKKVDKYRLLKSGMMSELLTGKVRLTEGS